jgi:hypothetical protein
LNGRFSKCSMILFRTRSGRSASRFQQAAQPVSHLTTTETKGENFARIFRAELLARTAPWPPVVRLVQYSSPADMLLAAPSMPPHRMHVRGYDVIYSGSCFLSFFFFWTLILCYFCIDGRILSQDSVYLWNLFSSNLTTSYTLSLQAWSKLPARVTPLHHRIYPWIVFLFQ